jgi:hypothetical protein
MHGVTVLLVTGPFSEHSICRSHGAHPASLTAPQNAGRPPP